MERALKITETATGLMFLASGGAKLAGAEVTKEQFDHFGYPQWFRLAAGATEVTAAAGFLAGRRDPRAAVAGGLLACGTMAGAIWTHLVRARDPVIYAAPAVALLGAAAWITAARGAALVQQPETRAAKRPARAEHLVAAPESPSAS